MPSHSASRILLIERSLLEHRPLSRFQSIFQVRTGLLSEWERIRLKNPASSILYYHPDPAIESIFAKRLGATALQTLPPEDALFLSSTNRGNPESEIRHLSQQAGIEVITSSGLSLFRLLDEIDDRIQSDLAILRNSLSERGSSVTDIENARWSWLTESQESRSHWTVLGNPGNLMVHPGCTILPGVVLDVRTGPIVLDEGVQVSPFSYLEGPLYAAAGCRLDNVKIGGGCILGRECRLGGEIENSLFGDFSNKHHEGFVGHSILGNWINLGALTTTSDLKNNYGEIRLKLPVEQFPDHGSEIVEVATGRIKFGSILGDCVKTSIGTMINTGTVLDAGSNVFGGHPPKYMHPLSWGLSGRKYQSDRFLADCKKIFARREMTLESDMPELLQYLMEGSSREMSFLGEGI
ncbi:MAG: hypothetical protein KDK33_09060 [Leptospiraceae bacterium]|nr:hypothetical protein [Leptospiraceae bacterium]